MSVTKELIESRIVDHTFVVTEIFGKKFTHCYIKMDNGFIVVGEPATCVDMSNWDAEIGASIAYQNSFDKIWALEGYRLMSEGTDEN